MKKILSSILFLIISIAAFAQVGPNDLIIQGSVSSTISTFPISNWPVTISGMGMTETVYTNANGFYSDTISNGSVIGPNQLFIVQTFDCDSSSITNTVSNNQGTVDVANVDFQICAQNLPCNADFSHSGPLLTNNSYEFLGLPNSDNAHHLWTFGDGASSEQEYPFHAYDTIGEYNVCHIVSIDGVCADTICITIQATENPVCTAEIVTGYAPNGWPMFSAIGGSEIATYNWILSPYDSNGVGYNGTYFYSTQSNAYVPAGTEYVGIEGCVSVTFTNGCGWYGCANFTAPPDTANFVPCNAQFSYTGPLFADSSYQFIGVANDSSAYHLWTFGDGSSSTLEMPFHSYEVNGSYSVCHIVGINEACADTVCSVLNYFGTEPQCDAVFNVIDNGNGTFTVSPLSPPTPEAVITWMINGPGGSFAPAGYPHTFNYSAPNYPWSICMTYVNGETGCVANYCDTIVIDGITDTCSAEFTYTFTNANFYAWPVNPHVEGNIYSHTVESSVYGILANNETSSNPGFPIPLDAGTVFICLNLTNEFSSCNATFCDTMSVSPDTSCTANIVSSYGSNGLHEFSVNGGAEIASYSWQISPFDSNGSALETFYSSQSNVSIPAGTEYAYVNTYLTLTFETGCVWTGWLPYSGQPDSSITLPCNAQFSYTGPLFADSSYQFIGVANDSSAYHLWTFGDGSSSSLEMPFHSYEVNGSYSVCHIVGINEVCADTVCSVFNYFGTEPQCDAVFNVIDNGNGTFTVSPLSLPTPAAGIAWEVNGFGANNLGLIGYPYSFNYPSPNNPGSICMTYYNVETGCVATYCDTIVNTCSAEFTYTFTNDNFYTWPVNPHIEGNSYSYSVESSVYGILANNETSSNPGFPIPLDAGTVSICLNLTNEFSLCNATYCDTMSVSPDTSCTADIFAGNGSNGWPEFNVNGSGLIASYNWNMVTYNSNGTALEFFNSIQSNASIPAGTSYSYIVVSLAIIFETGCQWGGSLIHTGQPDSSITCNASIQYNYVGDVPNPSMFPYQFYSAYSSDTAAVIHSWTTSDGQTSTSYSPLFGFAPGTYTVCHSVSNVNGLCSYSTCISLTVVPDSLNGCTAMFSPALINFITNEYLFSNTSSDLNASFIWQFGDGSTESGVNATHTFTSPGFYPVTLSMTGNGCFDDYTYNLTILPNLPSEGCSASFDYTSQVTNPREVVFDASSSVVAGNNPIFIWNFGDGTTGTGLTVTHTYSYDGFYTVCLTAFSDSCSNTSCGGVYAMFSDTTTICDASFTLQGPTNPDDYGFIGVGNNQNAYHLWTFGDGTSSTLAAPFHGYDNPGTYEVCHITGIEGVCADTVCNTFYIGLYISGTINVGANCIDFGSVKLYSLDTISNSVELIGQYPMNNNLCYYDFTGLTPGIYLVRAGLSDSSAFYNDYVPTYFGSQYYWNDAEPIYLTQSGFLYNISLIYGSNPGGNGTVNGSIDDGPFRLSNPELSSAQSPVLGAQVIITDLAGVPQRWVRTDNLGDFAIPDLAYGTYRLIADEPGMTCLPIEFTLSEQTPGVTIDLVMGDEISGIVSYETALVQGDVYPNPSNTLAKLNIELMKPASLKFTMTSITGQTTWIQTSELLAGKSTIQIPVQEMSDGLYLLSIYSENGQLLTTRKMQVLN